MFALLHKGNNNHLRYALEILSNLDSHNEQIENALNFLVSKRQCFAIIGKGRTQEEKSIVYVENCHFYGMGYLISAIIINEINDLKEHVTRYASNQYIMQLIYNYSEKYLHKVKNLEALLYEMQKMYSRQKHLKNKIKIVNKKLKISEIKNNY